mgnify:CR=1 FL=1
MISRFKISFTENTEVGFIDPVTMKKQWYLCYYGRGTSMEVADILSGNTQHIFAICTDGEIVFVETKAIRIENL